MVVVPPSPPHSIIREATPYARAVAALVSDGEWAERAEVLKENQRTSVLAGTLALRDPAGEEHEAPVVVKTQRLDRAKDLWSRLFGSTRLLREWRGSELLRHAGVPAARPFVLYRGDGEGGRARESLLSERLPGRTLLEWMALSGTDGGLTGAQERAVATEVGRQVALIARAGLVNRDHKPSNLIAAEPAGEALRVGVIDAAGVRTCRDAQSAVRRMLFALTVEPIGAGVSARSALRMRALRSCLRELGAADTLREEARRLWREIEEMLRDHGDPTPEDDPLARLRAERGKER